MITIPQFTEEQVAYLKRLFPEVSPKKGETLEDLHRRGGQCDVVRHIEQLFKEQQKRASVLSQSLHVQAPSAP